MLAPPEKPSRKGDPASPTPKAMRRHQRGRERPPFAPMILLRAPSHHARR